jgi:hypothetical protein
MVLFHAIILFGLLAKLSKTAFPFFLQRAKLSGERSKLEFTSFIHSRSPLIAIRSHHIRGKHVSSLGGKGKVPDWGIAQWRLAGHVSAVKWGRLATPQRL